jgi:bacterioferritin
MLHNKQLISNLNQVLSLTLTAIDQLYLHGRLYKKWGLSTPAKLTSEKSKSMMLQLNQLINHIQQLGGSADTDTADNMLTGNTIQSCLELDMRIASECQQSCLNALNYCNAELHQGSIDLLNQFISQLQGHNNWLTAELNYIQAHGIETFIKNEIGINQYWKLAAS